ncbi:hypothetical protein LP414_12135 [Polaromonas sp. P1(28)-13]|nr:hypothetical protein LP414_12135 [Polaromonas sp. P1(28)-13]
MAWILKVFISFAFTFALVGIATAARAPDKEISAAASLNTPAALQAQAREVELAVLKTQLEESRRFQDQILNTVWWALGSLATTAALLVGYGWYTSNRVHEHDKIALRQDLQADARESELKLKAMVDKGHEDAKSLVEKAVVQRTDGIQKSLRIELAVVNSELCTVQMKLKEAEREKWIQRGVSVNALSTSVELLEVALKAGRTYDVSGAIDALSTDLSTIEAEQKAAPEDTVDSYLVGEGVSALNHVKDNHAPVAQELKRRMLALRTGG